MLLLIRVGLLNLLLQCVYSLNYDPGEPLYLTPLLKAGNISQALELSRVHNPILGDIKSYSGYFTVNETYNSNIFFWYFPPLNTHDIESSPVLVWLQGGPGASSLYGLFQENGPFVVNRRRSVRRRKYSWNINAHVIYIDNPVGVGWSFTENDEGYARNQTKVGEDLYNVLVQFFQLFQNLTENPLFVSGESYGGKFVTSLGYTIYTNNENATQKINLQGLIIGDGFCDPENQINYADYLYQIGLLDSRGRNLIQNQTNQILLSIKNKQWVQAYNMFNDLINNQSQSLFYNLTSIKSVYNYLSEDDLESNRWATLIQKDFFQKIIHVGNNNFSEENSDVVDHLQEDFMQSVSPWISTLLTKYRFLIYNGQLDVIVPYPLTENYLANIEGSLINATRCNWRVDGQLAGYAKVSGNLTEVLVRDAGHMVPKDQPKWTLDLIYKFMANKTLC